MNAPTAATVRNGSGGRGTRKQAGTATTVNRIAANSSGGTDAHAPVDDDEVEAPQGGDEGGERGITAVHATQCDPGRR